MTPSGPVRGFVIAAPSSGSGKTVATLALLALLRSQGLRVSSGKIGPDYIDPAFHQAATGRTCFNLDSWAMRQATLQALLAEAGRAADLVVVEGVMGLFDGVPFAAGGADGSTAELARLLDLPVILVLNAKGQGATAAAVLKGLAGFDPRLRIAGVIFNNVGSAAHGAILAEAVAPLGIPLLATIPRSKELIVPERHLGLKQAGEMPDLAAFLRKAAEALRPTLDVDRLMAMAGVIRPVAAPLLPTVPPLGQRIAVAQDIAFAFAYPFQLEAWRRAGAEVLPFSPLADAGPPADADAVFLPGGYPELHAGGLAGNSKFPQWVIGGCGTRRGDLRRMRRLHGPRRGAGRRAGPAPPHGRPAAGRHQLRQTQAASRLPDRRRPGGGPARRGGRAVQGPRVPLLHRGQRGRRRSPVHGERCHGSRSGQLRSPAGKCLRLLPSSCGQRLKPRRWVANPCLASGIRAIYRSSPEPERQRAGRRGRKQMSDMSRAISVTGTSAVSTRTSTLTAALFLALFGAGLIYGVGFAGADILHNAAHDVRHSNGFPCH